MPKARGSVNRDSFQRDWIEPSTCTNLIPEARDEIGGSYTPLFLIVEAHSVSDAIDELADSEEYSHHIVVPDLDLGDFPEDDRHYGPSRQVIDLDHVMVHGQEGVEQRFYCTYHGEGLPLEGMKPTGFCWGGTEV